MRRLQSVLLAAVAVVGFVSLASAADMPVKGPVAAPVAYNWTGFYVGGNVGYGWGNRTTTFTPNDDLAQTITCGGFRGGTCAPPTSFNINGALGGLQAGYNWQFNQNWLLGIETDFDWSRISGSGTSSNFSLGGAGAANFQATENVKWFGTVRGRLGFLPTNNMLVYGTAGFAYGRVDESVVLNAPVTANFVGGGTFGFDCAAAPQCFLGSSSRTSTGWTGGAGVEIMIWSKVTFKMEYLYVNLGSQNVNVVAVNSFAQPNASSFQAHFNGGFNVVRAGLNWKY